MELAELQQKMATLGHKVVAVGMVVACYAGAAGGGSSHGNTSLLISNSYKTIDGANEMPSPDGGKETGHLGDGACVISWILK